MIAAGAGATAVATGVQQALQHLTGLQHFTLQHLTLQQRTLTGLQQQEALASADKNRQTNIATLVIKLFILRSSFQKLRHSKTHAELGIIGKACGMSTVGEENFWFRRKFQNFDAKIEIGELSGELEYFHVPPSPQHPRQIALSQLHGPHNPTFGKIPLNEPSSDIIQFKEWDRRHGLWLPLGAIGQQWCPATRLAFSDFLEVDFTVSIEDCEHYSQSGFSGVSTGNLP